jgi:hypothetical protein
MHIQPPENLYTISHVVSLFFTMPTDTLRHVVLFLHGSFALPLGRRSLISMRITFLRLRRVRKNLLLIMLHVVDRITTRLLNFSTFRLGVVVNLKSLKLLGQGRHNQVNNELILESHVHRLELRSHVTHLQDVLSHTVAKGVLFSSQAS